MFVTCARCDCAPLQTEQPVWWPYAAWPFGSGDEPEGYYCWDCRAALMASGEIDAFGRPTLKRLDEPCLLGEPESNPEVTSKELLQAPLKAPDMPIETPNIGTSAEHADAVDMSPQLQKTPISDIDPAPIAKSDISDQSGKITLPKGAMRILTALARCHRATSTAAQLGTLTKLTPSGGTWTSYIGTLKAQGLISQHAGLIGITPAGLAALGKDVPREPMTTAEVLALWEPALKAKEREMLRLLIAAYPQGLPQTQLADRMGLTHGAGTFGGYLGTLRQNDLAHVRQGVVSASPTLFPGTALK